MKNLCDADLNIFYKAERLAYWLAGYTNQNLTTFLPHTRPVIGCSYGYCDCDDKILCICFRERQVKRNGGEWLKKPYSINTIIETVAHEVAHLTYRYHYKPFKELEKALILRAKEFFKKY